MRKTSSQRMVQLVDWSAAVWAGLLAGALFLLLNLILLPLFIGGNGWVIIRLMASPMLGAAILSPPATFAANALAAALVTHFVLSILFSMLTAFIIHRGCLLTGILGGALIGLFLYLINFYAFTFFFPWFFAMRSWVFILTHILFGVIAGGVYEGLEVEEFVPAD